MTMQRKPANRKAKSPCRALTAHQLATAAGGDIGSLGNDWIVGGTGQDAPSSPGTGKTLSAPLLGTAP